MTKRLAALALGVAIPLVPARADGLEDLASLEARVSAIIGGPVIPLDRRLMLSRCPAPVAIDPPAMNAVAIRCAALGWRLRVMIPASAEPLAAKQRIVIKKSDEVEITYRGQGFELISQGNAMNDAAIGERVLVKRPTSAVEVRGVATGPGSVEIPH